MITAAQVKRTQSNFMTFNSKRPIWALQERCWDLACHPEWQRPLSRIFLLPARCRLASCSPLSPASSAYSRALLGLARALTLAVTFALSSPASSQCINFKFLGKSFDGSVHLFRYQFDYCSRETLK